MQNVALDASMHHAGTDEDLLVLLCDRRQIEMAPAAFPQQLACQVVLVQALHDENDGALFLVIEAGEKCRGIPVVGSPTALVRLGFVGLHRVIDNDEICAPTGEGTTDWNDE